LGGEKVDIIKYDDDAVKYITNALSPAKIIEIKLDEQERKATVTVASDQLSLAIGKGGQNARLAARLTNWKIDIVESKDKSKNTEAGSETAEDEGGSEKIEIGEVRSKKEEEIGQNENTNITPEDISEENNINKDEVAEEDKK
jgi:N utilization substance protein A